MGNAGGVSPVLPTNKHGVTTQQSLRAHAKVDHPVISVQSHGVSGTSAGKAGLSAHAAAEAVVLAQQQQYRNAYPSSAQGYAGAAQAQVPGLQAHAAAEAAVLGRQAQFANGGVVGASGNIGPSGLCGPSGCVAFRR